MAHYNIFLDQLSTFFPTHGLALWDPGPIRPDRPVEVGDVGFFRRGTFCPLFNALLPADDPSHVLGVPENYEPLVPKMSGHIQRAFLPNGHYRSGGIGVEREPDRDIRAPAGPDDLRRFSYTCPRGEQGAVLYLPVGACREDTLARVEFEKWILKHICHCYVFVRQLGLQVELDELTLVTGCDRTKSWTNVAFLGSQVDARVSFGVKVVDGPNNIVKYQFSPGRSGVAVVNPGPEGVDLPENQCVFVRGVHAQRLPEYYQEISTFVISVG